MKKENSDTITRYKLNEAKFFLSKMKEDNDNFEYYNSAFLAAARSVTFFMQKEYNKIPEYRNWYFEKQNIMKNNDIMKILNEKRVMTLHTKPIKPLKKKVIYINETIQLSSAIIGIEENKLRIKGTPKKPTLTKVSEGMLWYYDDYNSKDVIYVSEQQISFLENLTNECESKFLALLEHAK